MRDSDFTISVIITTFNRRDLVERAVRSVLAQSHPADDIVIIDDGSTDCTEDVVRPYASKVRYIWKENRGISTARNLGIQETSESWVTFLDVDDEWHPAKLGKQVSALKENPEYRVCYTNEIWIRRGRRVNPKKIHQKFGGHIFEHCLPLCIISPSSVIIHRDVFGRFGLFDPALPACEDYDMWLRICAFLPILYLEEPLITKYGGHEDQLSRKYWGMDRFRIYALEKIVENPQLEIPKRTAAIRMLLDKIDVYLAGARKRSRQEEVAVYQSKRDTYSALLDSSG
jgi:glycosyltransferase involved in cell wall biosynthesis